MAKGTITTAITGFQEIITAIGTGLVSGGVGGGLANLYQFTVTKEFQVTMFILSICFGAFAGYITNGFTHSGAISGVAGAMSMKIFEFMQLNGNEIMKKVVESRLGIKLENKGKK